MDYAAIDTIIAQKSLATNPAFGDELTISIEPIFRANGCPLGLYFPVREWSQYVQRVVPAATVVLPPDATEGALLHELGHRHGHYYYNDLSERYAEDFRKRYQKGRALLYLGNDFSKLSMLGVLFEEGERGAVEVALLEPLASDELYDIKSQFNYYALYEFLCECIECGYLMESAAHCMDITCPRCGGQMRRIERPGPGQPKISYGNSEVPWVRFEFTKGVDWMVIIGGTVASLVAAGIGTIGYAVYKISKELPWAIPLSIAAFLGFLMLRSVARRAERVGITKEIEERVKREIAAGE